MKFKFKYPKENVFNAISTMILQNAKEFSNKDFSSIDNLHYNYRSNNKNFKIKIADVERFNRISFTTELVGQERYLVSYNLIGKKRTTLKYSTKLLTNSKLQYWNHVLLSKSIFFFNQRSNFKKMCNYIEGILNDQSINENR